MNDVPPPAGLVAAALSALGIAAAFLLGLGWPGAVLAMVCCCVSVLLLRHLQPCTPAQSASQTVQERAPDLIEDAGFTRILDGFADPIFVTAQGRVLLANSAALGLLGEHILGRDVRMAIRHPAAAAQLAANERISMKQSVEIVGLGARDQRWRMQIMPIDPDSAQGRLLVRLEDQSADYAIERAKIDFVANASHELRTPLAAILGFIETLSDPKLDDDPPTRTRFLKIVEGEARRMQQLVDDLMSLSRIEADKHRLPDVLVDIAAIAREAVEILRMSLGVRGSDIELHIAADGTMIRGDRAQISQLMHNLIDNAAKYGRPGTAVSIRLTAADARMLRLTVEDHGEGIPREHLHRLTERFYRVDAGRSRAMGGTGLGLAIVKHIVERHRGRLDIASSVGKGTTVTILLPCEPSEVSENDKANALSSN